MIIPKESCQSNPLAYVKSELVNINTGVLVSGQAYQRPIQKQHLRKLTREWSAHLMEPLAVSYRDGKFYLVDGQHRVAALRERNGGKDVTVLCKLYRGLTYEMEARLFFKLD